MCALWLELHVNKLLQRLLAMTKIVMITLNNIRSIIIYLKNFINTQDLKKKLFSLVLKLRTEMARKWPTRTRRMRRRCLLSGYEYALKGCYIMGLDNLRKRIIEFNIITSKNCRQFPTSTRLLQRAESKRSMPLWRKPMRCLLESHFRMIEMHS